MAECEHCQRLREDNNEFAMINGMMQRLLHMTANALKGDPPENVWHDWSDLPKVALATVAEMGKAADEAMERGFLVRDLQAEVASLKEQLDNCAEFAAQTGRLLKAANDRLREGGLR